MDAATQPLTATAAIRRMAAMVRPHAGSLAVAVFLTTLASSILLVMPLGIRELLDTAVRGSDRMLLSEMACGLLALYLVRGAVNFLGQLRLKVTAERVVNDLRVRVYAHLHSLDLGFFARNRVSDLISRITNDVAVVRSALSDVTSMGVMTVCRLIGSVGVMVFLNRRLAVLVFVVAPIMAALSRRFGHRLKLLSARMQDGLAETNVVAQEGLAGIRLVQSFARADYETERYRAAVLSMFETMQRMFRTGTLLGTIMDSLFTLVIVAVYWYGGLEVIAGRLTAGDLVASVFYAQNLAQGLGDVVQLYVTYATVSGACSRVFAVLDTRSRVVESGSVRRLPPGAARLTFDHVSFSYDNGVPVLCDICLEIHPGKTLAIVGVSGAGKTTLLNLIPRLMDVTAGAIAVEGIDIRAVSLHALRSHVALVSQDVYLFNSSLRDNIRYGRLDATDAEVEWAARQANAHDFIQMLPQGYDSKPGEAGVRLSGGQRQRIAIARALLKDAPILLLDEATSSLDSNNEVAIQDAVQRLQAGRTTIIVTHRLSAIRDVDRIIVLEGGKVTADGTHHALLGTSALYASLTQSTAAPDALLQPA